MLFQLVSFVSIGLCVESGFPVMSVHSRNKTWSNYFGILSPSLSMSLLDMIGSYSQYYTLKISQFETSPFIQAKITYL